jgi:hypothetical protein
MSALFSHHGVVRTGSPKDIENSLLRLDVGSCGEVAGGLLKANQWFTVP